jgi:hypothetical protein
VTAVDRRPDTAEDREAKGPAQLGPGLRDSGRGAGSLGGSHANREVSRQREHRGEAHREDHDPGHEQSRPAGRSHPGEECDADERDERATVPPVLDARRPLQQPRPVRRIRRVSDEAAVKEELEAAIAARTEMGPDMEPAVIDAFVARIERRLVERGDRDERALKRQRDHEKEMVLGSMAISVPLLAIAAVFTGLAGVVAVLVALVVIAVVSARQR